jgi:hypothetical protein
MSAEKVVRKTISIDPDVWDSAEARMKRLKLRKFSRYVAALIEQDVKKRGPLTVVREEEDAAAAAIAEESGEYKPAPKKDDPKKIGFQRANEFSSKRKPEAVLLIPQNKWDGADPKVHPVR